MTLNFTVPQWHCAACVVRSEGGVSSTIVRMDGSSGLCCLCGVVVLMVLGIGFGFAVCEIYVRYR